MKLKRWNHKTIDIEEYEVPNEWNVKNYSVDFSELVNCASCGVIIPYWGSYTSKEIYSTYGGGYAICKTCHKKEKF